MKLKSQEALKENQVYEGTIRRYKIQGNRFLTFVELDEESGILYLNSQQISQRKDSPFFYFCTGMKLLGNDGKIDFDILIDVPVIVEFKKGRDGTMFISMMDLAEYDDEEDAEEVDIYEYN